MEAEEGGGGGGGGRRFVGRLSWEVFIFAGIVVKLLLEDDLVVDDEPLEVGRLEAEVVDDTLEGSFSWPDFLDCLVVVVESLEGCDP